MFDMHLGSHLSSVLRLRFTREEISAAVRENLARVKTHHTETEERLTKALAAAKCDAPRERLLALLEETPYDLTALDATACEILNSVRLLEPLSNLQRLLTLISERHDFVPGAVQGHTVLLSGDDYETLMEPFSPARFERRLMGPALRPMRRLGIGTALGRGLRAVPNGGFDEEPSPTSINELLKKPDGSADA